MTIRLTITSKLFGENSDRELMVNENLVVKDLIDSVVQACNLPADAYILRVQDNNAVLNSENTLSDSNIRTGMILVLSRAHTLPKRPPVRGRLPVMTPPDARPAAQEPPVQKTAALESATGTVFTVDQRSMLIGRPHVRKGIEPEINLLPLDPDKTSSRPHARITRLKGQYYLESLASYNLAYVNGEGLPVGKKHHLKHLDQLQFGAVVVTFKID